MKVKNMIQILLNFGIAILVNGKTVPFQTWYLLSICLYNDYYQGKCDDCLTLIFNFSSSNKNIRFFEMVSDVQISKLLK